MCPVKDAFYGYPAHPRSIRVADRPEGAEQMPPDAARLSPDYLCLDPDHLARLLPGAANEIEADAH